MFAALCDNQEFFKNKLNLAIMLAPVARVDRMTSATLQKLKDNENARAFVEKLGPEVMPSPNVEGKISSGFFKATGLASFGVSIISDDNPNLIS